MYAWPGDNSIAGICFPFTPTRRFQHDCYDLCIGGTDCICTFYSFSATIYVMEMFFRLWAMMHLERRRTCGGMNDGWHSCFPSFVLAYHEGLGGDSYDREDQLMHHCIFSQTLEFSSRIGVR
jgi:hypothetical protein